MNDNCLNVKAHCVILGTDLKRGKKYVLSTIPEDIVFPCLNLDSNAIQSISTALINYLHPNIDYVSELELMPQIVNAHSVYIDNPNNNDLNILYGFVIHYQPNLKDWHWIEFKDLDPHKYSNIIFEVIQKLY